VNFSQKLVETTFNHLSNRFVHDLYIQSLKSNPDTYCAL
jgi:hypothetical protein